MANKLYIQGDKEASAKHRLSQIRKFDKRYTKMQNAGHKGCKIKLMKSFCKELSVSWQTFYEYYQAYHKNGVDALVPKWGWRKGRSDYEGLTEIIESIYHRGKSYAKTYKELVFHCEGQRICPPSYMTMIRIIQRKSVNPKRVEDSSPPQTTQAHTAELELKKKEKNQTPQWLKPDWIKITDKKAFDLAVYKYSLILPMLDPEISKDEKRLLIDSASSKTHKTSTGEAFSISKATIYKYISDYKSKGLNGLLDERSLLKIKRHKNKLTLNITIDLKRPLEVLAQIHSIIDCAPEIYPEQKKSALKLLEYCINASRIGVSKSKQIDLGRKITAEEIQKLEQYAGSMHKIHRERARMLLMADSGNTMMDIALETGRAHQTIYGWVKQFKAKGINFIEIKRDYKKTRPELRDRAKQIIKILHAQPTDYGFNRTSWRLADIAQVYMQKYGKELSTNSVGRAIKEANYTWKRARKVLISNDPKYREKTKRVLSALQNLGPQDAFFFVDEAGPWPVKKYGGKSYTAKDEVKIYPQIQKIRGRVTFIAALDATRNQMAWLFTPGKDTAAVVALIKILFFKYRGYSRLIITWDCASWHGSKGVKSCLATLSNLKGPEITILPLPKRAQFLNVIESVFSGTKRAVVDNSNYESAAEMKKALDRHFTDRNQYFSNNPKRAGNKIWDKEIFDIEFFESGLHKRV